MRLPRPRLTIRRMMLLIAVVAISFAGVDLARKRQRLWRAERAWPLHQAWLDEGRITIDRFVTASWTLADAQMALCSTRRGKVAALAAHIERTTWAFEAERRLDEGILHCHGGAADLAEVEYMLEASRELLARLTAGH